MGLTAGTADFQVNADLLCPDAAGAAPTAAALGEFWTKLTRPQSIYMAMVKKQLTGPPSQALVKQVIDNSKFTDHSSVAQMSTRIDYARIRAVLGVPSGVRMGGIRPGGDKPTTPQQ